ncbi:hypothetical protein KB553_18790 [Chryseobacterium rhizoplanae]|uniref:tetratricopeptide repeat protein n=1 Tax=Chryseobacterium rhizoplanae TaxID=1609531 RepID=UPI001CE2567F|nr:hypothetical protein [Chryseobacterium rhizoplanae]UCA59061.1 hypothetical protein KB553_18790 [Chryseobacterium rhizoplanae]
MYKYVLILFLAISFNSTAQVNTQLLSNSSWTQVRSSMLDGSRDLSRESNQFLVWKFSGNKICEYIDPWAIQRKKCTDLKFEKNLIRISDRSGYQIEILTSDSLIVVQKVDGIAFPDKIRKIKFVKTSVLFKDFIDKSTGDSIVITSRKVTPILTKDITTEMMETYLQKKYTHDFTVDGEIRIFPKKQIIEVIADDKNQNKDNKKSIDLFKMTLQNNYKIWDIAGFEDFEKIIIPYRFKSKSESNYCNIVFFNRVTDKENNEFLINIKDKFSSTESFKKGVEAINNQKFDKAIELFNKAYDNDNTNIDALYNIVSISFTQNNTVTACLALKRLKDLEQTEGTKLYNEKCSEK